ncbi:hypothetical protein L7F22_029009 [Adiantum nelumboides]|nr:hypothetical protein [Adiantum nelumboides]
MKKRKQSQQVFDDGPSDKATAVHVSEKSDAEDDDSQEIVDVDFEFFDPKEEDFHGVKALLRTYLDDATWDLGGFVDIILGQPTVGTVIKTAEDESPIGVITVLNLGRYKEKSSLVHVYDFLERNVSDSTKLEVFNHNPSEVGLLISERLINIPEELAPPLYKGLLDEVSWAIEDEPTKFLRDSFKFKQYLILSRIFQQLPKKEKEKSLKKQNKQRKQQSASGNNREDIGEIVYIKPEDELFHRLSHWSCKFPANSEAAAAHEIQGLKQFRLVMLLNAESMELFKSQFCIVE